jgi:hypothetical protein
MTIRCDLCKNRMSVTLTCEACHCNTQVDSDEVYDFFGDESPFGWVAGPPVEAGNYYVKISKEETPRLGTWDPAERRFYCGGVNLIALSDNWIQRHCRLPEPPEEKTETAPSSEH